MSIPTLPVWASTFRRQGHEHNYSGQCAVEAEGGVMVHTLDITTDQGFKALTLLRHQAKLDRKPLFVFIGPAPENHIT